MISALEMRNESKIAIQNKSVTILNSIFDDMDIESIEDIMLKEAKKGNTMKSVGIEILQYRSSTTDFISSG